MPRVLVKEAEALAIAFRNEAANTPPLYCLVVGGWIQADNAIAFWRQLCPEWSAHLFYVSAPPVDDPPTPMTGEWFNTLSVAFVYGRAGDSHVEELAMRFKALGEALAESLALKQANAIA